MKKSIIYLAAAAIAIPTLNSCKKGEEDPLSFNSRDSRITGTWLLKTLEEVETTSMMVETTNSVNTDKSTETEETTETTSVSGGAMTWTQDKVETTKDEEKTYDFADSKWEDETNTTETDTDVEVKANVSMEVAIYDNNTYVATTTSGPATTTSTVVVTTNGTGVTNSDTETEDSATESTEVEEGTWSWGDADKDKIIIDAGPLSGTILRLAKDELIISYEEVENEDYIDVEDEDFTGSALEFSTHDNDDAGDTDEGTSKSDGYENWKKTHKSTWEKTDKESSRE